MDKKPTSERQVIGLIGVGFDQQDGETRITRNEDMMVLGGSQETHGRLQDLSIKFNESLKERGKRLPDAEVQEVIDLLRQAFED